MATVAETTQVVTEETDRKKREDDLWLLILALLDDDEPQQAWERLVPPAFAGLIVGDGFIWDEQTQSYRSDSGTTVNSNAMQRIVLSAAHAAEIDVERGLKSAGQSDEALNQWRDSSLDEILSLYIAGAAAGIGGIERLDEDALRKSALAIAMATTESLENIVDDLQANLISPAQAINRAGMNAQQMNGVFQNARRIAHMNAADENGVAIFTTERNVLTETAQHCDECPELTARGWVTIGTLPLPGARQCMSNCKCHLEFGKDVTA